MKLPRRLYHRLGPRGRALALFGILGITVIYLWRILSKDSRSEAKETSQGHHLNSHNKERWKLSSLWVEDQRPQVNPHRFAYLINEPDFCDTQEIDLLVLVSSSVSHVENRDSIRQTWGGGSTAQRVKVLFMLGQGEERQSLVREESGLNKDIVQEDFKDSYRNLTLKTVMGLKWAAIFCPQVRVLTDITRKPIKKNNFGGSFKIGPFLFRPNSF